MNEIFIVAGDYLKGNSVYPKLRRTLNLLFNISIASFIYEKCYGSYSWLNYNDYKGVLDFFVKGNFFIPFSIFLVVYGVTQFSSIAIFKIINLFKTVRLTREILLFQFKKETIDENLKGITKASKYVSPSKLTKETMVTLYKELRNKITPEAFNEIEKELKSPKQNLEANFTMAFRMTIAITIYFISLPQFGWKLYVSVMIILVLGMYILMIAYRFLDILPTIMRKFHSHAEEYLESHLKENNEDLIKKEQSNEKK